MVRKDADFCILVYCPGPVSFSLLHSVSEKSQLHAPSAQSSLHPFGFQQDGSFGSSHSTLGPQQVDTTPWMASAAFPIQDNPAHRTAPIFGHGAQYMQRSVSNYGAPGPSSAYVRDPPGRQASYEPPLTEATLDYNQRQSSPPFEYTSAPGTHSLHSVLSVSDSGFASSTHGRRPVRPEPQPPRWVTRGQQPDSTAFSFIGAEPRLNDTLNDSSPLAGEDLHVSEDEESTPRAEGSRGHVRRGYGGRGC